MAVADEILAANIRHAVYLERYTKSVLRKMIAALNRSDYQIVKRLETKDLTAMSGKRQKALLKSIRMMNVEAHKKLGRTLRKELQAFAAHEIEFNLDAIDDALPVQYATATPTASQVYAAAIARPIKDELLGDLLSNLSQKSSRRLSNAITSGVLEGRTNQEILQTVRGTRAANYTDGIQGITKKHASTIVRTAVQHTANVAREEVYYANSDLIKGVMWVSTLDGKTSATCRGFDGEEFPLREGPRPPAHLNCRSIITAIVKSWKELGIKLSEAPEGTRESMNGQVPASMTYGSFLKTQSKAFQDGVLGVTKGKLFRDGGLTLDKFTDASGKEYNLKQLRQRQKAAFTKAKIKQ